MDIEEGGRQTAALLERLVTDPSAPARDVVLQPVKIVNRMSTAAFATQDQQILRAILFIHRNVRKKISVADVTAEAALSRRLLERRFKDVTGKTLYEYITELKLKDFAEQLVETDEQVMTIALSMGENDTKSISPRDSTCRRRARNPSLSMQTMRSSPRSRSSSSTGPPSPRTCSTWFPG